MKHKAPGQKRIRWTYEDWIAKARDAIKHYQPRHLADLLAVLHIPHATSKSWAVGQPGKTIRGKLYTPVAPKTGWLEATADVPRPKNHELHMLRYINDGALDAIAVRQTELEAGGSNEIESLRRAVDEVLGAARKAGEERRAARRREKYGGIDPEQRLSQEEREEKMAAIKEARREFLNAHHSARVKKPSGRIGKTARQKRISRARLKAAGGRKGLARATLEAKRQESWQKAAAELYGVKSFKRVPRKSPEELAAQRTADRTAQREGRKPLKSEPSVVMIDYAMASDE